MKKFQFRLNPLLRLRQQQEDQKKRAVAALISDINLQQQQALELADNIKAQGQILKDQFQQKNVDVNWVSHYFRFVAQSNRAIQNRIENVKNIQNNLNVAREQLAHAAKQTKILEKLKEKQQIRHNDELNRIENRELDELSAAAYIRKIQGRHKTESVA